MDASLSVKPVSAVPAAAFERPEPVSLRTTVQTELSRAQSVTAPVKSETARNDPPSPSASQQSFQASQAATSRDIVIDSRSREVILRTLDVKSGRVVRQVPDAALMRQRAYMRAMENGETLTEAAIHADREI